MRRSDVLDAVRDVNPLPDPGLVVDPAVRASALQRALSSEADRAPTGGRRWRRRVPLLGILAPLLVAAAAFAATQILSGAPYRPPWEHRSAQSDMGLPIAASVRLLPVRVPDADGGPPWGMRVMRTTRGDECMQVGRVVRGQLGVLGQDGIFRDDHRFHLLPAFAFADYNCALVGSGGYAVIGNWESTHASGLDVVGTCYYPGSKPVCPAGDLRFIAYGLLGPDVRAILVKGSGTTRTLTPVGREGAYLVVRRVRRVVDVNGSGAGGAGLAGGGGPGAFPGAVAVVYRDGSGCPIAPPPSVPTCVYAHVHSSAPPRLHLGPIPVHVARIRPDSRFADEDMAVLRFTAPVTVRTGALDYVVVARNPGVPIATTATALSRDVRKGAPVTWAVNVARCTRTARLRLYVGRSTPLSVSGHGLPTPLATLANLTLRLPPAPAPAWCQKPGSWSPADVRLRHLSPRAGRMLHSRHLLTPIRWATRQDRAQ
jgi:hypothetical protein